VLATKEKTHDHELTNSRGVQAVAETESSSLPHFSGGVFRGTLNDVFRTRAVPKEHLINQLEELIRRNDESGLDDAGAFGNIDASMSCCGWLKPRGR
jgi:hypothetical protein